MSLLTHLTCYFSIILTSANTLEHMHILSLECFSSTQPQKINSSNYFWKKRQQMAIKRQTQKAFRIVLKHYIVPANSLMPGMEKTYHVTHQRSSFNLISCTSSQSASAAIWSSETQTTLRAMHLLLITTHKPKLHTQRYI